MTDCSTGAAPGSANWGLCGVYWCAQLVGGVVGFLIPYMFVKDYKWWNHKANPASTKILPLDDLYVGGIALAPQNK